MAATVVSVIKIGDNGNIRRPRPLQHNDAPQMTTQARDEIERLTAMLNLPATIPGHHRMEHGEDLLAIINKILGHSSA
jgi:hypothetical protein